MSESLIERLRKARQSEVQIGEFKFTVRRPTDAEATGLREVTLHDLVASFVIGWGNVKESDIVPGGNPVPAAFSTSLWAEWSADHPEFWGPIADAVMASYSSHRGVVKEAEKN